MDPVTKTLFTPFEPLLGAGVFAGARWHAGLTRGMVLQQNFKPFAAELSDKGLVATPELPVEGDFLQGFVLLQKNADEARYEVARVLKLLKENGVIAIAGANDAGGRRAKKILKDFGVADVQELAANHARVAWGVKVGENDAVKEALEKGALRLAETGFVSQPGLFAWDRIDKGSEILAACLPDDLSGNGADFGCGYGFLSRHVLQKYEIRNFYCFDADHRAVQACRENLKDIKTKVNYAWEDLARAVPVRDLDFIVMNPPFHEGKKTDSDIGKQFIETASRSLRQGGQLWMVANAGLPYESVLGALFASHEKITEKNGFKVFRAVR
ncbi:MAG TPA: class I SAM-dependent methyltransferase [Alphaproteobacteria bacterium]|nr:class I SAM-dependent methyltransferase [Micavibrio sp.]MBK9562424.1 class I SAM-dependent methyltransferase [Micavibrio sp.]HQX26777.1 class I SAM-dependent methyltransferase [Alphaproteobacteria bacterium]